MTALFATTNPCRPSSPLRDATNENWPHPDPLESQRSHGPLLDLYQNLDSSESVPSFHDSLWDAVVQRGAECQPDEKCSSWSTSETRRRRYTGTSQQPYGQPDPSRPLSGRPQRYSSLPPTFSTKTRTAHIPNQLQPISEKPSMYSIASSTSPHFIRGPARKVLLVQPQQSYESIRLEIMDASPVPHEHHWWLKKVHNNHRRSFSLNDVDCLGFQLRFLMPKQRQLLSSSSEPDLVSKGDKYHDPAKPQQPPKGPPTRSPTPPGVPSFGSPEALTWLGRPHSSPWWERLSRSSRRPISAPVSSSAAQSLAANLNPAPSPAEEPRSLHRRLSFLGASSGQGNSRQTRRASMPAGVLRADDGTYVRGRFGGRVSGHGVNSRGLSMHPMQRIAESKENEGSRRAVSCTQPGTTRSNQQVPAPGPNGPENSRISSAPNPYLASWVTNWLGWDARQIEPHPVESEPERRRYVYEDPNLHRLDIRESQPPAMTINTRPTPSLFPPPSLQPHPTSFPPAPTLPPTTTIRPSIDTTLGTAGTAGSHCASPTPALDPTPKSRRYLRLLCLACCGMDDDDLDGRAWYGNDRPWTRETSQARRERKRREGARREGSWVWRVGRGLRLRQERGEIGEGLRNAERGVVG